MKSLKIFFSGKNEVGVRREDVAPPGEGEFWVRTRKSLISTGTEGICLGRNFEPGTHWDNWVKYPFYPGYLSAGEVLEVGAGVTAFRPGDRVAIRGRHQQIALGAASRALPIPDGISDEEACWMGISKITQVGVRRAAHELGDAVVVIGCGMLGQLVTQYARVSGARAVIAIDTAPLRLEMAQRHGATHTLQMDVGEAKVEVLRLTEGRGADVVYDITGHAAVFSHALGLARRFGKLILLGDTGAPTEQRLTGDVITRGVTIIGAHDGHAPQTISDRDFWNSENMERLFFNYLQRGLMQVGDLVTHRFAPQDAPEAYRLLQTDRANVMGVIFDWTQVA